MKFELEADAFIFSVIFIGVMTLFLLIGQCQYNETLSNRAKLEKPK